MDKRKLFIDFDSTIVNSIKRICEMYNDDFKDNPRFKLARWEYVERWDFTDQCKLMSKQSIEDYFSNKRFFIGLEFMENAEEVIKELSNEFDIYVVSMGWTNNLAYKEKWITANMPYVKEFIGCNFDDVEDKRHINMSGGIIIDDCSKNLFSSNAEMRICYGDLYEWNVNWQGKRCWNWTEVYDYLME